MNRNDKEWIEDRIGSIQDTMRHLKAMANGHRSALAEVDLLQAHDVLHKACTMMRYATTDSRRDFALPHEKMVEELYTMAGRCSSMVIEGELRRQIQGGVGPVELTAMKLDFMARLPDSEKGLQVFKALMRDTTCACCAAYNRECSRCPIFIHTDRSCNSKESLYDRLAKAYENHRDGDLPWTTVTSTAKATAAKVRACAAVYAEAGAP